MVQLVGHHVAFDFKLCGSIPTIFFDKEWLGFRLPHSPSLSRVMPGVREIVPGLPPDVQVGVGQSLPSVTFVYIPVCI